MVGVRLRQSGAHVTATTVWARKRPPLSDKHPVAAHLHPKRRQVNFADALASAAPKGRLTSLLNEFADGIKRKRVAAPATGISGSFLRPIPLVD